MLINPMSTASTDKAEPVRSLCLRNQRVVDMIGTNEYIGQTSISDILRFIV